MEFFLFFKFFYSFSVANKLKTSVENSNFGV